MLEALLKILPCASPTAHSTDVVLSRTHDPHARAPKGTLARMRGADYAARHVHKGERGTRALVVREHRPCARACPWEGAAAGNLHCVEQREPVARHGDGVRAVLCGQLLRLREDRQCCPGTISWECVWRHQEGGLLCVFCRESAVRLDRRGEPGERA